MKEKTAVEWLISKLSYLTSDGKIITHHKNINELVEQALEFEKQERHSEYMRGFKNGYSKQELK
jgi:TfoX/Sxy family transcriptional regulator of competence genes